MSKQISVEESDKYYIPAVNEIHIGLECEIDNSKINKDFGWEQYIVGEGYENVTINRAIFECYNGGIRIKYLDQEDIKSLGFIFIKDTGNKKLYQKDNINLIHYTENKIGISLRDPSKNEVFSRVNIDPYLVNYIAIKNKAELEFILKSLNII